MADYPDGPLSGRGQYPAQTIIEALERWREPHGNQAHTYHLAGALISLAREVDRITPQVIDHDGGPTPGSAPVYTPREVRLSPATRLRLLLLGLKELRDMLDGGRTRALTENDLNLVLQAGLERIASLYDTHKPASDADTVE